MSSGARVSIPNSVRKTIQNIKEIAGNHSEDEIYAMLKECSMDPNETVQKLLLQDTFHEVKRKRDRKKENFSNKESAEMRWRPGMQGQGCRVGRGNYSPRCILTDATGGRNFAHAKENGINKISEKGIGLSPLPISQETQNVEITPATSSLTVITSGPTAGSPGSTVGVHTAHLSAGSLVDQSEGSSAIGTSKLGGPPPLLLPANTKENPCIEFGKGHSHDQLTSNSSNSSTAGSQVSSRGVYFSASDPVLVPSQDSRLPGAVGAIKREVGFQRTPVEQISSVLSDDKSTFATSEVGSSAMQGTLPGESMGVQKNQLSDSAQPASSSSIHSDSSVIRPSSNCNGRSQQAVGPQKAGSSKEWKPKPNPNLGQGSGTAGSSEVPATVEANTQLCPVSSVLDSKEATINLQRKLEELHISDHQHVIIPNHLHIPEAEKICFCFGSFDASFGLNTGCNSGHENDGNPTPLSETYETVEEMAEQSSSDQNASATTLEEDDYPEHPQSPTHVVENLSSGEGNVLSTAVPEYSESKQETALSPGNRQYPMIHTSPNYSFGFLPLMVGSQLAPFESSDSQTCVIPQLFNPASYYAQFYRSGDSDGHSSPFHSPGATTKYSGNGAVLSPQTSESAQEGGNTLVFSTAGPTSLVTQAAGVMQSSIAVTQQPLPLFRHPTGMPIPHYHPQFVPYGHYISPLYAPTPAIHQFLSNGAFPQQPQASGMYPALPGATAKYSVSQYKSGSNTGNTTHVGVAGSCGPYGSFPAGYNPISTSTAGNSNAKDDLVSNAKESDVYVTGQQSKGPTLWIAAQGRDISGLPTSSFYNIPPQGQVTFTPTQTGHGTFTGIYHPTQTVPATTVHPLLQQSQTIASAADIVRPTASIYQQPQHAQINWPNNY